MSDIENTVEGEVKVIINKEEKKKEEKRKYIRGVLTPKVNTINNDALEKTTDELLSNEESSGISLYAIDTKDILKVYNNHLTSSGRFAQGLSSVGSSFTDAATSAVSSLKSRLTSAANAAKFVATSGYGVGGKSRRRAKKSSRAKKANRRTRRK